MQDYAEVLEAAMETVQQDGRMIKELFFCVSLGLPSSACGPDNGTIIAGLLSRQSLGSLASLTTEGYQCALSSYISGEH